MGHQWRCRTHCSEEIDNRRKRFTSHRIVASENDHRRADHILVLLIKEWNAQGADKRFKQDPTPIPARTVSWCGCDVNPRTSAGRCAGMGELSDLRTVERFEVTSEGIKAAIAIDTAEADRFGAFKRAIVAAQDIVFGIARMYQGQTESISSLQVWVFRDIGEAKVWLGVPQVV